MAEGSLLVENWNVGHESYRFSTYRWATKTGQEGLSKGKVVRIVEPLSLSSTHNHLGHSDAT